MDLLGYKEFVRDGVITRETFGGLFACSTNSAMNFRDGGSIKEMDYKLKCELRRTFTDIMKEEFDKFDFEDYVTETGDWEVSDLLWVDNDRSFYDNYDGSSAATCIEYGLLDKVFDFTDYYIRECDGRFETTDVKTYDWRDWEQSFLEHIDYFDGYVGDKFMEICKEFVDMVESLGEVI